MPPAKSLVRRPSLGVLFRASDALEVRGFVPVSRKTTSELKIGDRILKINDKPVTSVAEVMGAMAPFRVGDRIVLHVERGGDGHSIDVRLHEWPREKPAGFDVLYDEVGMENKTLQTSRS